MSWKIGLVDITMVRESVIEMPMEALFPDSTKADLEGHEDWLARFLSPDGALRLSTHALVLQTPDKTIVVDTCTGTREVPAYPDMNLVPSAFMEEFTNAGFDPADVDYVVCTHLHIDHVGWNTKLVDGEWVPTFPNARYIFAQREYEHWDSGAEGAAWTFDGAVRPLPKFGVVDFVEQDHVVTPQVRLIPTPGHSPGHVSVLIESEGEQALITGDVTHHPVQFVRPDWRMFLDGDPEAARVTRLALMERFADSGTRIFGTHFPDDSTGFLTRAAGAVRFE